MNYFLTQEKIEGYLLDANTLYRARASFASSRLTVEALEVLEVKPLPQPVKRPIIASSFPSSKTLARPLELALTKTKDIDSVYLYEAEPHLPFPIDSCIADKVRLSVEANKTKLQLFAAQKDDVKNYLEILTQLQLDPEILCPKSLALCHFAEKFRPEEELQILIDIDELETTCLLIQRGKPLFCRAHPEGFAKNFEINEEKLPDLHSFFREIARILLSFQQVDGIDQTALQEIAILFTGPIVQNGLFTQLLANFLNRNVVADCAIPSHVTVKNDYSWKDLCTYATPIGLTIAFSLVQQEMSSVNFRKDEFAFGDKWLRWKKELIVYFCLMTALSLTLFAVGNRSLESTRVQLVEQYATLISSLEKMPQENILELSSEEIDDGLFQIEKELAAPSDDMALHPDVPRVSDLLMWLSNHPKISMQLEEGSPLKSQHLKLQSITYTMLKRPEKGKLKEHYQVRVDLEFTAPTGTMAREFHDALLVPNQFIDPKSELKWSAQRGQYRASFILKDRTQYPQNMIGGAHAGN